MLLVLSSLIITLLISLILLALASSISARTNTAREKLSPYECGFDPKNSARLPFSTRFFLLTVIFLVFDIEVALLLPMPLLNLTPTLLPSFIAILYFLTILLIGLVHE